MSASLPALRRGLDLMPSPVPDQPGLLIRDPRQYSAAVLIIPPALIPCLACFDGEHAELDLRETLVRVTGEIEIGGVIAHLTSTLSTAGFLEDGVFAGLRDARHQAFAAAPRRDAVHAGAAYPKEAGALRERLTEYLAGGAAPSADHLVGIAAPHVSPEGGWRSYRAAYAALPPDCAGRSFVILGTSHYGDPERFGLTRKPFVTPYGEAPVDLELVTWLEENGGPAVIAEDYCHAVEHSIEFQVVFLQHLFGPQVRIVPILCGPLARATYAGGTPEDDPGVARFLEALRELARREQDRILFVLGIDMAHVGRRYGDPIQAKADRGPMARVAERDRQRLDRLVAGDAEGFWALVQQDGDDLKWCGASPLYALVRAVPGCRGELLRYEQWNIDDGSVVSFAGMAFRRCSP